ncbi:hypothetical protein EST38_g7285 [Candolleomyces aberdarensis]|uniref:Uncharacterized protein n=1 Tax=Candolleomyces aberdarensis TaxID=2316362 RepID=A0A4Q2DIU3_9AGAR|nr:hypothetical protein EST38_g7285 [Candolleomyces aberdarensis]
MGNTLSSVRDVYVICTILYILYSIRNVPPTETPHSDSSAVPRTDGNHGGPLAPSPTDGEHSVEENSPHPQLAVVKDAQPIRKEPSDEDDPPTPTATSGIDLSIDVPATPPTDDGDLILESNCSELQASEAQSEDRTIARERSLHIFSKSNDFSIVGATFNNIAGNMIVNNADPADLRRMFSQTTKEMSQQYLRDLPSTIGHSGGNAMVITDALGETVALPEELVSNYEVRESPL